MCSNCPNKRAQDMRQNKTFVVKILFLATFLATCFRFDIKVGRQLDNYGRRNRGTTVGTQWRYQSSFASRTQDVIARQESAVDSVTNYTRVGFHGCSETMALIRVRASESVVLVARVFLGRFPGRAKLSGSRSREPV